ncbi:hypothetical protein CB1_000155033 [Camelus ferus]|nr:hypothetical protein CB1_000155033 [Camelus ferus]
MMSSVATEGKLQQAVSLQGVDPETCMIVFKNHWMQVVKILEKHDPLKNTQAKYGSIPPDEASAVQNYVEHMLFLLIEEQAKDAAMGPILELVVSENIMEKLFLWSLRREFTDETKMEQLKMYEMLVTQAHQPLLCHKPILRPLMMLLSSCSGTATPTVEGKLVVLLNQLCSILAKDPSILELFFHTSEDQGAANFLIFSLLIPFIHREGAVGQQARDALLFIMSLSAENSMVAHHIVDNTYFCPVLATGLSGLYSSLPTKLEEKGEEWHCLLKDDWLLLPPLVQFMNSLEFCNAVIQVTVEEVMTTTAYLDLFLRSISEPALLEIFLRFILLHQHENVHILDTLTSRINTPFRLCVVSLALFRTLIGLHCEDVMLQLVLRYLIPCNHMMLSQRWAVKERDCYSVSAAKLLALTPVCCSSGITLTLGNQERDYILWSKCTHDNPGPTEQPLPEAFPPSACIVEYGKALDISYLQYLWEAHTNILRCMRDCHVWSALYDGDSPDPEALYPSEMKKNAILLFKGAYIEESDFQDDVMVYRLCAEKDAEDTRNSREDPEGPPTPAQTAVQSPPVNNGPLPRPQPVSESESEEEQNRDDSDEFHNVSREPEPEKEPEVALEPNSEVAAPTSRAEQGAHPTVTNPEGEDFIAQYDQIIKELDSGTEGFLEQSFSTPDPLPLPKEPDGEGEESKGGEEEGEEEGRKEPEEEEDDFDAFISETPAAETQPSPFGARDEAAFASQRPARTQSTPFTGPFISVVLSKLENMLENSLHVNLLLIGIITQLASYPQPLLRSFLLNTNMVFQPSVRSLYQVLASVKNKIEQFASVERDFPGLLIQAQQYLLLRVDVSDPSPEALTKDVTTVVFGAVALTLASADQGMALSALAFASLPQDKSGFFVADPIQDASRTGSGKNFLDGPPRVLQPFLTHRARMAGAPPSLPPPVRNAMLAAALFPEFLKELAALAQEHSILCCRVLGDLEDSCC